MSVTSGKLQGKHTQAMSHLASTPRNGEKTRTLFKDVSSELSKMTVKIARRIATAAITPEQFEAYNASG